MSNLLVQNIKHTNNTTSMAIDTSGQVSVRGEGSATTTNLQNGLSKSWCHWDQTPAPHDSDDIYNSFNIASVTDKATGESTMAFTNNMGGANWSSTFYANVSSGTGDSQFGASLSGNIANRTTTGYLFECYNGSSMLDSKHCDAHTFGS